MKKLFFFRSSASSNGSNNPSPQLSKDKQVYSENPSDSGLKNQATDKFRTKKYVSEYQTSTTSPSLRKSRSYSAGTIHESGLGQKSLCFLNNSSGSPCSSKISQKQSDPRSTRYRTLTPERKSRAKWFEDAAVQIPHELEKPECIISSSNSFDSSESSSYSSSNVSSKVLDRYIDGEQLQESSAPKNTSSQRSQVGNGNGGGKRPPRAQFTAPASLIDGVKQKPRSYSFRETKGSQHQFSTRDWVENGSGHDSPRKLAKHVIEKLSQSRVLPRVSSKGFDSNVPITIEDIYGKPLNKSPGSDGDHHREILSLSNCVSGENCGSLNFAETAEDIDVELHGKSKEAEKRAMILSKELEQENFLQGGVFSGSGLIQTIRSLAEERFNMALEVSAVLNDRVAERASAREELRLARIELDSRTRRLEKEKNDLQLALEKELDRRSSEWSFKLEKYQAEEHRLRERVRELAEQNVSLQREVSSFNERDIDSRSQITSSEQQLQDLTTRMEKVTDENQNLQQSISEIQEKFRAAEEDRVCIHRNYEEKEKECTELHRSVTRMLRTCSEQEKTIDGLREGLREEVRKKTFLENFDSQLGKLQMELMRLTGVEQALRKEVESYRNEVDSLRHENINLLHRLKGISKEGRSTFKLDQELWNRVCCLQNQGPKLLNESIQLCMKLLEHIKERAHHSSDIKHGFEVIKNGLDGQFVVESDMKLQGFKRGAENLMWSLQNVSSLLQEKAYLATVESQSHSLRAGMGQINDQNSEYAIRSELKAELLLTSLLRDKLYSKELDVEQLQAELAAAVRGNDILRCEVQNAMDTLSCITHKMKDLELQMIKKEDNINRLQNDLQECTKELTIVRGILPKISEERDLMWNEVKQYSEQNMLLNSEVNVLKKKVEALDEDILLKEGQITILKDSLGKPFDLLVSP